jgi:hypothetical protein
LNFKPWPEWLGFSYAIMTSWTLGFLEDFRGFLCGFTKVMRAWKTPKKITKRPPQKAAEML